MAMKYDDTFIDQTTLIGTTNNGGGRFFIVAGPSGVGKDAMVAEVRRMLETDGIEVVKPKSYTTRTPRISDPNDGGYIFVSEEEFTRLLRSGAMLECTVSHGNQYGMSHKDFEAKIASPENTVMMKVLDHHGAMSFKRRYPLTTTTIFIRPPSLDTLAARLENRGDRDASEADFKHRMLDSETEMGLAGEYDYVITNDVLQVSSAILYSIVRSNINCTDTNDDTGFATSKISYPEDTIDAPGFATSKNSPRIETDRLIIRRYNISTDLSQVHRLLTTNNFPCDTKNSNGTLAGSMRFITRAERKPLEFIVREKNPSGGERGVIGVASFVRNRQYVGRDVYCICCCTAEDYRGNNYGTEIASALVAFAFLDMGVDIITASCPDRDQCMKQTLERTGMRCDGIIRDGAVLPSGERMDIAMYSMKALEFIDMMRTMA